MFPVNKIICNYKRKTCDHESYYNLLCNSTDRILTKTHGEGQDGQDT